MFEKEYIETLVNHPRWVFASVVGSNNYGTANEYSDVDLKVVYLPEFGNFYRNKFNLTSNSGPEFDVDYTCHPLHDYVKHSLKGNINFWELWFSNHMISNYKFIGEIESQFIISMREAIRLNFLANFRATRGMAKEKFKRFWSKRHICCEQTPVHIDRHNKEIQHSIRLLSFLKFYIETAQIELELPFEYGKHYLELRNHKKPIDIQLGADMFNELDSWLTENKGQFEKFDKMGVDCRLPLFDFIRDQAFKITKDNLCVA